ncbi:MAG: Gfo/Idh/MocA family oxidoreductase [Acidobacteriota bacterium]|nr:Gfo/Idh/MocA family oxidoreductase [Acidobacteriota bacterium]
MPSALNSRWRVAFVGTGGIATAHAAALKTLPNVDLVAVCDLSEPRAREFQKTWSVPETFQDLGAMLERVSPDAVHVLLPPAAHAKAAEICLAAGSHVFVEKPFCISIDECRRVQKVAEQNGRQIGINHNLTFMPGLLKVTDAIRQYRLGAVEHVTVMYSLPMPGITTGPHAHWMFENPGNIIFELGSHPLSAIYRYLGAGIDVRTAVSGEMTLTNGQQFYRNWQSSLVCQRGTAQLLLAVGKPYYNIWFHILGEDGEAFIDVRRATVRISGNTPYLRTDHLVDGSKTAWSIFRQSLSNFQAYSLGAIGITPAPSWQQTAMASSCAAFHDAVSAGKPAPVGAVEGTAVVEMCEAMARGASTANSNSEMREGVTHG